MIHAPTSFLNHTLWPEFEQLSQALSAHLLDVTNRIIREEVFAADHEAEEIAEPSQTCANFDVHEPRPSAPHDNVFGLVIPL